MSDAAPHHTARAPKAWSIATSLLLLALGSGCHTAAFYQQAVVGHSKILLQREPIQELIAETTTPPELRQKLLLILELRTFAQKELHLPAGNHYLHYADLKRPYVVWDIYAAPELSLEAKTWWYPFVGSLSYRGYFAEAQARKYAADLEKKGFDVFVGGVEAYSTLGWFRDPVLNTFLGREELDLADLLFHELAHQRLFLKGDTDFNEAFATTVAREGVRRWLRARRSPAELQAWEERIGREDEFYALLDQARRQLERLYAPAHTPASPDLHTLRRQKERIIQELHEHYRRLKARWNGNSELDAWFTLPINNARLNAESTYHGLLPAFQNLLAKTGWDFPSFYAQVQTLARLDQKQRQTMLATLSPPAFPLGSSSAAPFPVATGSPPIASPPPSTDAPSGTRSPANTPSADTSLRPGNLPR